MCTVGVSIVNNDKTWEFISENNGQITINCCSISAKQIRLIEHWR